MVQQGQKEFFKMCADGKFNPEAVSFSKLESLIKIVPEDMFDKYDLEEIRERCVAELDKRNSGAVSKERADWAEERITGLKTTETDSSEFWKKILSWYLVNTHGSLAIRAIEFSIKLHAEQANHADDICKMIIGKLRRIPNHGDENDMFADYESYWNIPSARLFLEKILSEITGKEVYRNVYNDKDFYKIRRAISIILKEKDIEFILNIEKILKAIRERKIQPDEFSFKDVGTKRIVIAEHLAFFREALLILEEERKKQFANANMIFGNFLKEAAGIGGEIEVKLSYPSATIIGKDILVSLEFVADYRKDQEKLNAALEKFQFIFLGKGFVDLTKKREDDLFFRPCFPLRFINGCCKVFVRPTLGANKFIISIEGEEKEIVGYVDVVT